MAARKSVVGAGLAIGALAPAIPIVKTQLAYLTKGRRRLPGKRWSVGASRISSSPEDSMFMVPDFVWTSVYLEER
jgi:hypothetical protein